MASDRPETTLPPYVVPAKIVDPMDRGWRRQHPYDPLTSWQDQAPNGEWRIYPTVEAAAADGMPYARKALGLP